MLRRAVASVVLVAVILVAGAARAADETAATSPLALPSAANLADAAGAPLPAPAAPADNVDLLARATEMAERFPAVEFDPELKAKELGDGVDPAFAYVRDHVRFEAYPGVLRAAKGAYMARAANAADRSLLLAQLLKSNGIKTR